MQKIIEDITKVCKLLADGVDNRTPVHPADVDNTLDVFSAFARCFRSGYPRLYESIIDTINHLFLFCNDGFYRVDAHSAGWLMAMVRIFRIDTFQDILYPNKSKVFISHSADDYEYVNAFVNMLEKIGVKEENLFCSSIPPYDIELNGDIPAKLQELFAGHDLFVIFMLSHNFYESPDCHNEMGAAWALKQAYQAVLLPGFDYSDVKGIIASDMASQKIGIKIDSDTRQSGFTKLKDKIVDMLDLKKPSETLWLRHMNSFLDEVDTFTANKLNDIERQYNEVYDRIIRKLDKRAKYKEEAETLKGKIAVLSKTSIKDMTAEERERLSNAYIEVEKEVQALYDKVEKDEDFKCPNN